MYQVRLAHAGWACTRYGWLRLTGMCPCVGGGFYMLWMSCVCGHVTDQHRLPLVHCDLVIDSLAVDALRDLVTVAL